MFCAILNRYRNGKGSRLALSVLGSMRLDENGMHAIDSRSALDAPRLPA